MIFHNRSLRFKLAFCSSVSFYILNCFILKIRNRILKNKLKTIIFINIKKLISVLYIMFEWSGLQ